MATTTIAGDESMATRLDSVHPVSSFAAAVRSPAMKPRGGARILSFLLQALVMAVALSVFFLFAGVAALILLHLFVAGRALRRRRRLIHIQSLSPNPNPYIFDRCEPDPCALSSADLKCLPSFLFSAAAGAADCPVCLEEFRNGDRCRKLPACGHAFHRDCVDRWLVKSPACPICRRGVLPAACGRI